MSAKLLFTLICDDVRVENTRKLVLVGVYNYTITFPAPVGLPPSQPNSPPKFALPKLCLVRRWRVDTPEFTAQTSILDPNNTVAISFETKLTKPSDDTFCQEVVQLAGPVLFPGQYSIVTTVSGAEQEGNRELFEVRLAPETAVAHLLSGTTRDTVQT
jgi:hypothetical protein